MVGEEVGSSFLTPEERQMWEGRYLPGQWNFGD